MQPSVSRTGMAILKETKSGGHFLAPVRMNIKLTFTPVADKGERRLALTRNNFVLSSDPDATWTSERQKQAFARTSPVSVDTDGDSIPDTALPGTSHRFTAGLEPGLNKVCCPEEVCHEGTDGIHCTITPGTQSCC